MKDTHKCCHDTRKKKEDKTDFFIKGKKNPISSAQSTVPPVT